MLYRRLLMDAIRKNETGQLVIDMEKASGPPAIDGIGPTADWQGYWRRTDEARRKASSWANGSR